MHANVFDLVGHLPLQTSKDAQALQKIFHISHGHAKCFVSPELSSKYGENMASNMPFQERNRCLTPAAWQAHHAPAMHRQGPGKQPAGGQHHRQGARRASVVQRGARQEASGLHSAAAAGRPHLRRSRLRFLHVAGHDGGRYLRQVSPSLRVSCCVTPSGNSCCTRQLFKGRAPGARVERQHAVTASNLFKYCQPCHGLVLFKHHDPLRFALPQLADLLLAAQGWFDRAAASHPSALHPFFLWNCGPRSGASQFHGHAQVALSQVHIFKSPIPHHLVTSVGLLLLCACDGNMLMLLQI